MKSVVCILLMCVLLSSGCDKDGQVEAVSGSTLKADKIEVLPPANDFYFVIGKVDGLKGTIIKYDDTFYRGGEFLSGKGVRYLKDSGIKTIISITPTDIEKKFCKDNGLELVLCEFDKLGPSSELLAKYLEVLKTKEAPFYVHCHGGSHRGGTLAAAFRVHIQGWDYDRALIEYGRLGGNLKDDYRLIESIR